MKKINTIEAAAIVGGIAAGQCEESYMQLQIGSNDSCQLVTTCADKKGNLSQTWKEAAYYNCAA